MESSTGWANDDALIAAATELAATLGEDPNHSVAAAAMDLRGSIYAGVNNRHFNGGPCAELVVLGWLAHAGPLATMVAVGDGDRSVISPCGRCYSISIQMSTSSSQIGRHRVSAGPPTPALLIRATR